jgi:glutathione-regulated potassium-efflux system ancillary protein KefF
MDPNRVLVLFAHAAPHLSRVNRRLAEAARLVEGVYLHDLYESYPDFYIDPAREHALLAQAGTLVFLFPLQWYSVPALLKEWIDVVLRDAWTGTPRVGGRRFWLVTSTGAGAAEFAPGARQGRPFADFLAPFEQVAAACGMEWLAPLVLHGAHDVDGAAVEAHVDQFSARLRQLAGAALPLTAAGDGT